MTAYPKALTLAPAEFSTAVRALILTRSGGVCEGCGMVQATQVHHRLFKSRGGRGTAANGLALCGSGNHTGCHGTAHSGAHGESVGWAIRSGFDPLIVPVFRRSDSSWHRFDNHGGQERIPAIDAVEYLVTINAIKSGLI